MEFERNRNSRRATSPLESLVTYLKGSDDQDARRKLELSMRYVEHVLAMYSELPVTTALPKVVDALFAYTAVDSTLRAALVGPAASADPRFAPITYELVYSVRDRLHAALLAHFTFRRDSKLESCLSHVDLEDMVAHFTRTLRQVFMRSVRESASYLADPSTRALVLGQCLSVINAAN